MQALNARRFDEAVGLAEQALALSEKAVDGDSLEWQLPQIAHQLAQRGKAEAAEGLFLRTRAELQRQAEFNVQPLLNFTNEYVRYLSSRKRWADAQAAIEVRRELIVSVKGEDSPQLEEIFTSKVDWSRQQARAEETLAQALELLSFQEKVHGEISQSTLQAVQNTAEIHSWLQNPDQALALRQKAVRIGEKLYGPSNMQLAWLLSQLAQDEANNDMREQAVAHMEQAAAIAERTDSNQGAMFRQQLTHLRQGGQPGIGISPAGQWFNYERFSRTDGTRLGGGVLRMPRRWHPLQQSRRRSD